MNKRYLLKGEVEKWNDILSKLFTNIKILVNKTGQVSFLNVKSMGGISESYDIITNPSSPNFYYNFSFSVVEKRKDDLLKLINLFAGIGFNGFSDKDKVVSLKDEVNKCDIIQHSIGDVEFVKFSYIFTDIITAIQVVGTIEDSVTFIQMMYEYEEDGTEVSTIKYPIGSVVCMRANRDIDYMVDAYIYDRPNSLMYYSEVDTYQILYRIVCIDGTVNSTIIRYGDSKIVDDNDICPSRTNNLNIILN